MSGPMTAAQREANLLAIARGTHSTSCTAPTTAQDGAE